MMKVPYLHNSRIEAEAESLLASFATRYGDSFPVSLEDLCETMLGIYVFPFDFKRAFGKDILGALCIEKDDDKVIYVSEDLDPNGETTRGRYRFTIAHEIGHYILHRHFLDSASPTESFPFLPHAPQFVCRNGGRERQEIQADLFAAFLLMPKARIISAWEQVVGPNHGAEDVSGEIQQIKDDPTFLYEPVCNRARELARRFHVSGIAMQRRLSEMKLLQLEPDPQLSLF